MDDMVFCVDCKHIYDSRFVGLACFRLAGIDCITGKKYDQKDSEKRFMVPCGTLNQAGDCKHYEEK